ncbi:MAG: restriction endonuclease [Chloroflexota bacterium]|nr:restriction endonuclease [Chloroflexota bacterium]
MEALLAIFSILYIFWPLILLFGTRELLRKGHSLSERIRLGMRQVFSAWLVWAFFLVFIYWRGERPILLLSESINHLLFILLGIITGGVTVGWMLVGWRDQRIKLSDAETLDDLLALSPTSFEALVAELFSSYGYQAETIGGSSDHGVDVLVYTDQGKKWVVQCKRYKHSVGEPVVRDLYGTMLHEEAQRAYLITTGSFTRQALNWAEEKPIVLYDGEALITLIQRTKKIKNLLSK